mmetsp:Transcript_180687/g.573425  ORF Transcript_180687/g.573425 Transcript_180687/m.573425 type:complete len:240 (+) Transcript_180687:36-755(+)
MNSTMSPTMNMTMDQWDLMLDCPHNPDCVQYNIRSWTYAALTACALIFLRRRVRDPMPIMFWFPYCFHRALIICEPLHEYAIYIGSFFYSLAMFWAHLYFSHDGGTLRRDLGIFCSYMAVVYIAAFFLPARSGLLLLSGSFVPPFLASIFALLRARSWLWFVGLGLGWLNPVAIVAFVEPAGLYKWLIYADNFTSFPLVFVAQLHLAFGGPGSEEDSSDEASDSSSESDCASGKSVDDA